MSKNAFLSNKNKILKNILTVLYNAFANMLEFINYKNPFYLLTVNVLSNISTKEK